MHTTDTRHASLARQRAAEAEHDSELLMAELDLLVGHVQVLVEDLRRTRARAVRARRSGRRWRWWPRRVRRGWWRPGLVFFVSAGRVPLLAGIACGASSPTRAEVAV